MANLVAITSIDFVAWLSPYCGRANIIGMCIASDGPNELWLIGVGGVPLYLH